MESISNSITASSALFTPITIRGVTFRNRVMVSPMNQYCSVDGIAGDWHFAHLAQYAIGGAGFICIEATKVEQRGLGSIGDLGIWSDAQVNGLRRIADFIRAQGAVAGIQLNHAGRKAGAQRPWEGFGPIGPETDLPTGITEWKTVAPSAIPFLEGWKVPGEMTQTEIDEVVQAFGEAARRADEAGIDVIELHGAHGYLIHQFLSPLSNVRTDGYGGSIENRMRFALEVVAAIRAKWPTHKPLFFRISSQDESAWTLDDATVLAKALKGAGVDAIDCSSGGINARSQNASAAALSRRQGFQVPFAEHIRKNADVTTVAVGLIIQAEHAESIISEGKADFVALAREMLFDPYWTIHAAHKLGVDPEFKLLPTPYSWWLERREKAGYER